MHIPQPQKVKSIYESDPLNLKKYDSPYYQQTYNICVMIPVCIGFSLAFFLIFFMSPRGVAMRQYQKNVFEWNSMNLAQKVSSYEFAFKVQPFFGKQWKDKSKYKFQNLDKYNFNDDEKKFHSMFQYQESYFWFNQTTDLFPSLEFTYDNVIKNDTSNWENFCLHIWWKDRNSTSSFIDIDDMPGCSTSKDKTKYFWDELLDSNDAVGINFPLVKQNEWTPIMCSNDTCQYQCTTLSEGIYKDESCISLEVLERLCIIVELEDNLEQGVHNVNFLRGCYEGDEPGLYHRAQPSKTYKFDSVPIEVRAQGDPYSVYAENAYNMGRDLTIFFWLSIFCLVSSFLLSIALFVMWGCIVRKSNKAYVRDNSQFKFR